MCRITCGTEHSGTLDPRVTSPMTLTLAVDGPLDAAATLARYHRWGEDPTTRVDGAVLRRVLRLGERLLPYEVQAVGTVDDTRLSITVADGAGAGAAGGAAVRHAADPGADTARDARRLDLRAAGEPLVRLCVPRPPSASL